jgi:hypothetical protein
MIVSKKLRQYLWNVSCKNFISKQPDRFYLVDGKKNFKGTMYFCSTILEAIACKKAYAGTSIDVDNCCSGDNGAYVVIVNGVYR